ncbi:hypothetical protein ES332_D05G091400v1 [Gossypium tomentosum]|uniref:Reverse transcriptase RNase H-like domain-containing protein n=1 Tax=Gossypium tomentosum TaxID=34277 RepID=A0A5D2KTJ8_GOSTO|nr:hypothetical protein ES332_D05G091400v1 [Gossypium tomentosum]
MNSLENFKIHYLDKPSLTLRTDCQATISFFNRISNHKPSRIRWLGFTDYITGLGIPVKFEHIKGEDNKLADSLSRLISLIVFDTECQRDPEILQLTQAMSERCLYIAAGKSSREQRQKLDAIVACTLSYLINKRHSCPGQQESPSASLTTTVTSWKPSNLEPSKISRRPSAMSRKSREGRKRILQGQQLKTTGPATGYHTPEPLTASWSQGHGESRTYSGTFTQSRG